LKLKLLITGVSGLLGTVLFDRSKDRFDVSGLYHKDVPLLSGGNLFFGDVTNGSLLLNQFRTIKPDIVVHTAAITNVDYCEDHGAEAQYVNVVGTNNVIEGSKDVNAFLIYISTDFVFDGKKSSRYVETDCVYPINFYGTTKLIGELLTGCYKNSCVIRTGGLYGISSSKHKQNFPLWVIQSLTENKSISVAKDQFNSPTVNVNLADAILEIAERKFTGTFNFVGKTKISRYNFASAIANSFGLNCDLIKSVSLTKCSFKAPRPKNTALDVRKAIKYLNVKPLDLKDSVKLFRKEVKKMR
jgi:dTDP-4-dehydrorhamnose reductase